MSNTSHNDESLVGGGGADCDAVASRYCTSQLRFKTILGGTLANLPRQSLST